MHPNADNGRAAPLRFVAAVLVAAPLLVVPSQVDFALLPQQALVQAAALALAVWVLCRSRLRSLLAASGPRALDVPLAAFLLWSALSLARTSDREVGLRVLAHWLACAVVYVAVSRLACARDVTRLARGALAGAALAAGIGLAQVAFDLELIPQAAGPAATMANREIAAAYLTAVAPLALLALRGRRRWPVVVAVAAILAFLPFTRSRAAAVVLGLQLVVLLAALLGRLTAPRAKPAPVDPARWRVPALAAALALIALSVGGTVAWTLRDSAKGRSLALRGELSASALAMAVDHPLGGIGLGRFGALYPAYGPAVPGAYGALRVEHSHDELLEVLAETGLPGLVALVWVGAVAAGTLLRLGRSPRLALRRAALAIGLSAVAAAVDVVTGFPLRSALAPLLVAVLLGLCSGLERLVAPHPALDAPPFAERAHRWLVWTVGPAAALVLAGATTLSFVRLAADQARREMALAEAGGRWQDAVDAGRRAVRLEARAETLVALARAELRVGHRQEALILLERVLVSRPYDATAIATLGSARWAAGDREGARTSWRLARALGIGAPLAARPVAFQPADTSLPGRGCQAGVRVVVQPQGLLDVAARNQLLTDVLACITARTGLRVDYDGAWPRQRVNVDVAAQPLAVAVTTVLEGLGINYVFSGAADTEGSHRLIVFGGSGSSGRTASRSPAAPSAGSFPSGEPGPDVDDPVFGGEPESPPAEQPARGRRGFVREPRSTGEPPDAVFAPVEVPGMGSGGAEPPPVEFPEPGQLTPTVRHWEPWPPPLSTDSPLRYSPASIDGA